MEPDEDPNPKPHGYDERNGKNQPNWKDHATRAITVNGFAFAKGTRSSGAGTSGSGQYHFSRNNWHLSIPVAFVEGDSPSEQQLTGSLHASHGESRYFWNWGPNGVVPPSLPPGIYAILDAARVTLANRISIFSTDKKWYDSQAEPFKEAQKTQISTWVTDNPDPKQFIIENVEVAYWDSDGLLIVQQDDNLIVVRSRAEYKTQKFLEKCQPYSSVTKWMGKGFGMVRSKGNRIWVIKNSEMQQNDSCTVYIKDLVKSSSAQPSGKGFGVNDSGKFIFCRDQDEIKIECLIDPQIVAGNALQALVVEKIKAKLKDNAIEPGKINSEISNVIRSELKGAIDIILSTNGSQSLVIFKAQGNKPTPAQEGDIIIFNKEWVNAKKISTYEPGGKLRDSRILQAGGNFFTVASNLADATGLNQSPIFAIDQGRKGPKVLKGAPVALVIPEATFVGSTEEIVVIEHGDGKCAISIKSITKKPNFFKNSYSSLVKFSIKSKTAFSDAALGVAPEREVFIICESPRGDGYYFVNVVNNSKSPATWDSIAYVKVVKTGNFKNCDTLVFRSSKKIAGLAAWPDRRNGLDAWMEDLPRSAIFIGGDFVGLPLDQLETPFAAEWANDSIRLYPITAVPDPGDIVELVNDQAWIVAIDTRDNSERPIKIGNPLCEVKFHYVVDMFGNGQEIYLSTVEGNPTWENSRVIIKRPGMEPLPGHDCILDSYGNLLGFAKVADASPARDYWLEGLPEAEEADFVGFDQMDQVAQGESTHLIWIDNIRYQYDPDEIPTFPGCLREDWCKLRFGHEIRAVRFFSAPDA